MSDKNLPLYATVDLGSNSFHMLILRLDPNQPDPSKAQVVTKLKRKVRLAAGLDKNEMLSQSAIEQGLDCLAWFALTLKQYNPAHCAIVATATLRRAKNADEFVRKAAAVLGYPIQIISGIQEASLIYQGASSTSGFNGKQLVIDIGGASTEIIIGKNSQPIELTSLNMGCVTWCEQFFGDRKLSHSRFEQAISSASKRLAPIKHEYLALGWQACFGASGTIQAIKEIAIAENKSVEITLDLLLELKQKLVDCQHIDKLDIAGLTTERALVFPSGLAILIAIFIQLNIKKMQLAGGALREGLLYSLINPKQPNADG